MKKNVKLKDGIEILIREMKEDDLDMALAFYKKLPDEDRRFLRGDVTKREVVESRIHDMLVGKVKRIVAIYNDKIIAIGGIELSGHEWMSHVGEIRLVVGRKYQRKGLGMLMAEELYGIAAAQKLEQIVVMMAEPQVVAQAICKRLGFKEQVTLPQQVRDRRGMTHDLIVMRCNLEALWQELEHFFAESDWQRTR